MEKPKDKRIRKFLNKPGYHTLASVLASVEYDKYSAYITFQISDCSRSVSLDFSGGTLKELSNTKNKIKIIKDSLEMIEKELDTCYEWEKYSRKQRKKSKL